MSDQSPINLSENGVSLETLQQQEAAVSDIVDYVKNVESKIRDSFSNQDQVSTNNIDIDFYLGPGQNGIQQIINSDEPGQMVLYLTELSNYIGSLPNDDELYMEIAELYRGFPKLDEKSLARINPEGEYSYFMANQQGVGQVSGPLDFLKKIIESRYSV